MTELGSWLDKLSATATLHAAQREYPPTIFLRYADGRQERVKVAGGGADYAHDLRMLALVRDPRMMALVTEMWMPRVDLPHDDADLRRLLLGELTQVRDLPADKIDEGLQMYGEHVDGEHETRVWLIRKDARRERRIRLESLGLMPQDAAVRFYPTFLTDHLLRELDTGISDQGTPPWMLQALRTLAADLSPEQRRDGLRRALGRVLLAGGGRSSRAFEDRMHAHTRLAVEYFGRQAREAMQDP